MPKRIFALVLAAVLVLRLLTGCGGQQGPCRFRQHGFCLCRVRSGPVHVTFWHAMNTDVIPTS